MVAKITSKPVTAALPVAAAAMLEVFFKVDNQHKPGEDGQASQP
jgi:hypothetical protein